MQGRKNEFLTLKNWGKSARGDNSNRKKIGPPGLLGAGRRANDPAPKKKSLVKKAQETAGQTTLRRIATIWKGTRARGGWRKF
jgi:hypothetical protein